jgi:hypothetical protein
MMPRKITRVPPVAKTMQACQHCWAVNESNMNLNRELHNERMLAAGREKRLHDEIARLQTIPTATLTRDEISIAATNGVETALRHLAFAILGERDDD